MGNLENQNKMSKVVKEFFAIGKDATEAEFRSAYSQMESNRTQWQFMESCDYSCFIIDTIYYSKKFDGAQKALEIIDDIYPDYEKSCPYEYFQKRSIHEMWARLLVEQDNEESAYDHLKKAAFYMFIDNVTYDGYEYFSFRSFTDYALTDIRENALCLAHPSTFNDPMDTILLRWNQYMINKSKDGIDKRLHILYQKVFDHLKVRCFVRTNKLPRGDKDIPEPLQHIENVNLLMWAHYARNHTGFCVKYVLPDNVVRNADKENFLTTRIGNVIYYPEMLFGKKRGFSVMDALYAKHDIWSYENEVRLVQFDANDNKNFKTIKLPENSIRSIYLGLKCTDENREEMKLLLRNRNIRLYQMEVDKADSYKLVKKRIM